MTTLPKARIVRIPINRKRALARWLNEWRIDRLLRENDREPCAASGRSSESTRKSSGLLYDVEPVRTGQVRLFFPFSDGTAERPRYVAVLRENEDGFWLVAPFSRFSEPAVPGEWKMGRDIPVLRNLCIWNARPLPGTVLSRSWVVDRMTDSKIAQALTIHKLLAEGREPTGTFSNRVGPPLVHPLDPRLEYLEEEREWFSALSSKRAREKPTDSPYDESEGSTRSLPLAAEERGIYKPPKRRSNKGRGADGNTRKGR